MNDSMEWKEIARCNHTNNTSCLQANDSLYTTTEIILGFGLSEEEIQLALRPSLHYLTTYAYIIWYLIGLPANSIAFFVWIQKQMLNSSGCYMAALALTDNIFLIVHCLLFARSWSESLDFFNHPVMCQVLPLLYTAAQYMSGLLVLEFTVEQYIAICHPFKRSRYCRVSIARKVIIGVTILTLLLSSPQAYFFTLLSAANDKSICTVRDSLLVGGTQSFWSVWTWVTEMLMFGLVPISCLSLNILVIHQVSRQHQIKMHRHVPGGKTEATQKKKRGTTTIMLLVVSLYWVCTEIPATITLCIKQAYDNPEIHSIEEARDNPAVERHLAYMTGRTIVELICFSRYSCKLFLYLATGRQFRKYLMRLTFKCNKSLQSRWSNSQLSMVPPKGSKATEEMLKLLHWRQQQRSGRKFLNDESAIHNGQKEPLTIQSHMEGADGGVAL